MTNKHKHLETFVKWAYALGILICIVISIYMWLFIKNDIYETRPHDAYSIIRDYKCIEVDDPESPAGSHMETLFSINYIGQTNSCLVFYTRHQGVEVFIEDKLVYSMNSSPDNAFSKTEGNTWNYIMLTPEDSGKKIRIVYHPAYKNSNQIVDEYYFGSKLDIFKYLIMCNFFPFSLALITVFIGIFFFGFTLINYNNKHFDRSLMMMGIFSICIGAWKIADLPTTSILIPASTALAYVPYFALLLSAISFVLYIKEKFTEKNNIIWYLPCLFSIVSIFLNIILQLTNVYDMRQLLKLTHLSMFFVMVSSVIMIIREAKLYGISKKMRRTFICILLCLAGFVADVILYYNSNGIQKAVVGIISFLIYILVQGIDTIKETKKLMAIGSQAKKLEEIAYHDQLTGLYNRTAYAETIKSDTFSPDNYGIIMVDLNNLKTCNDTLGHEMGDKYIADSTKIIKDIFGEYGSCYRMGGDEFCILTNKLDRDDIRELISKVNDACDAYNKANPDIYPMDIACGYAFYDQLLDYDIGDTLRRADKFMYENKLYIKMQKGELPR
ncbi:MAG: GGDEF domain-containing protein [Eubacteriales bacterium]|nr:GGDEF domain-containing protein [Eubacteriales bacterium]